MATKTKIFGIGLSRTGTTTLHSLLEQLGYKSRHFLDELLGDPDWSVIDAYDAVGDTPIPKLYKECDRRYPGSKFILTTRNQESWLASMKWMLSSGKVIWHWGEALHEYHQNFYGTKRFDRSILERHWKVYHRQVRQYFSGDEERLLTIDFDRKFHPEILYDFLDIPGGEIVIERTNARRRPTLREWLRYLKPR